MLMLGLVFEHSKNESLIIFDDVPKKEIKRMCFSVLLVFKEGGFLFTHPKSSWREPFRLVSLVKSLSNSNHDIWRHIRFTSLHI